MAPPTLFSVVVSRALTVSRLGRVWLVRVGGYAVRSAARRTGRDHPAIAATISSYCC